MDVLEVFRSFQTQEQAIEYLELVRWRGHPICPYCKSDKVCRHVSGDRAGQRWQCEKCHRAFAVTVGTIFHGTHMPLGTWFLLLALMLNAKKPASSYQIARDIGVRRPTVWSMMHRVREAMASDTEQAALLSGIVEADEVYIQGKPHKGARKDNGEKNKWGRGTKKTPVVGLMESGGRVMAKPFAPGKLTGKGIKKLIMKFVDCNAPVLMTDEYSGYSGMSRHMVHATVNHAVEYANGIIHTNRIEGFWSLVKRAWYGQHHHYSRRYMGLYIFEACYKFNHGKHGDMFDNLLDVMVGA